MLTKVYGKVNLSLGVTGKVDDMHTLDSVMVSIEMCDEVRAIARKDNKLSLSVECVDKDFSEQMYLAVLQNAANKFFERYGRVGADITVKKTLPLGAGLGGGSAPVVGLLKSLSDILGVEPDADFLLSCGSDVPFMWQGGAARVSGKGEKIEPFACVPLTLVLAKPEGGVSTKDCFALFDEIGNQKTLRNEKLVDALECDRLDELTYLSVNDLEEAAFALNPSVKKVKDALIAAGAERVVMSGSGSGVVAVCEGVNSALAYAEAVGDIASVAVVSSRADGIEFIK